MGGLGFASKVTHGTLAATVQADSGDPVLVWGFTLTSITGDHRVIVEDADGNDLGQYTLDFDAQPDVVVDIPFVADNGIQVRAATPSANALVTIFHSHPGA